MPYIFFKSPLYFLLRFFATLVQRFGDFEKHKGFHSSVIQGELGERSVTRLAFLLRIHELSEGIVRKGKITLTF